MNYRALSFLSGLTLAANLGWIANASEKNARNVAVQKGVALEAAVIARLRIPGGYTRMLNNGAQPSGDTSFQFFLQAMDFDDSLVYGAPFSADSVSDTIQTLPNGGTRIVQHVKGRIYRDSQGRIRIERTFLTDGTSKQKQTIDIRDPANRVSYTLDPDSRTARQTISYKVLPRSSSQPPATAIPGAAAIRTEQLGKRIIEGVECEGTRNIITVPASAIGNDPPIEMVNESWYSPELKIMIMTKQNHPRLCETSYRVTNINRSEPDAALFNLPSNYAITSRKEEFIDEGYEETRKKIDEMRRYIEKKRRNSKGMRKSNNR